MTPEVQHGGAYFLPKNILRVTVKEAKDKPRSISVETDIVPDRNALAQVGFNLSAFADDDIKVDYEPNGLLKGVASVAKDRTGDIFVQLVKTAAGFRATAEQQEAAVAIYEFDPFSWREATFVNSQLMARFSSCVEVELRPGVWSPGCRANKLHGPTTKAYAGDDFRSFPPQVPGIYYRRPVAHRVHIMESGITKQFLSVELANDAPIFRIDVDRTAFVERKTTITFQNGVPTSVQVVKPSEGLAAAQLPLTIAKAIISAPVEALSEHKKVQDAQSDLLEAEARRVQAEQKLASLTGTSRSAVDLRSGVLPGPAGRSAAAAPVTAADCAQIGITDPRDCAAALGR